jgi:hypothetical protein
MYLVGSHSTPPKFVTFICGFICRKVNTCLDTFKNQKDTERTNAWLKSNGISVNQIYAGTAELFQAQKLASTTLRDHGDLLEQNQAHVLHNFLRAANSGQKRLKITQAQCFKVLNITKQVQRKHAKLTKRKNTGIHQGTTQANPE